MVEKPMVSMPKLKGDRARRTHVRNRRLLKNLRMSLNLRWPSSLRGDLVIGKKMVLLGGGMGKGQVASRRLG